MLAVEGFLADLRESMLDAVIDVLLQIVEVLFQTCLIVAGLFIIWRIIKWIMK